MDMDVMPRCQLGRGRLQRTRVFAARSLAAAFSASLAVLAEVPAQVELSIQGQPYAGGLVTLSVAAPSQVGVPVIVLVGLDALPILQPIQTGKGPYFIGNLITLLPIGVVPAGELMELPVQLPPYDPLLATTPAAVQAYVGTSLSNPAVVSFEAPYLLPANIRNIDHPVPSQGALFGDQVAVGDLNGDGSPDIIVGAWFEKVGNILKAGRVYVFWGPDHVAFTQLTSPVPSHYTYFGLGLDVADFDGDGIDDLIVYQGSGDDPPGPGTHGKLHFYPGGVFSPLPAFSVQGLGTALDGSIFGRVSGVGDLDASGSLDVVIGVPSATVAGKGSAGRLEIYDAPGFGFRTAIENPEPKVNDFFGTGVAMADVNEDGNVDIVEASGRAAVGSVSQAGRAHVFDGPSLALLHVIDNPDPDPNDRFGEGLAAHDLNGDGLIDIIASDVRDRFYIAWGGQYAGPISSWSKPPSPNPSQSSETAFGYFFAKSDVNADGAPDLVISDVFEGDLVGCATGGGTIYVMMSPYFSTAHRIVDPLPQCLAAFGWYLITSQLDADEPLEIVTGNNAVDVGGVQNVGRASVIDP